MRILIQRVAQASVSVVGESVAGIDAGLLLLVGIGTDDTADDVAWMSRKVVQLRIFDDATGVMNRSVLDVAGDILAVSQFTLLASTRAGNRPSYSKAAPGNVAAPLFAQFVSSLSTMLGRPVRTGVFGAPMRVTLVNDGPVTIWLNSRMRE